MGKYAFAALFFEKIKKLWYNILKNEQRRQIMNQKIIYAKWLAIALRKRGHQIVKTEVNPTKPQFDIWYFNYTPELDKDIGELTALKKDKEYEEHVNP